MKPPPPLDWVRIAHRGLSLLRELRGDADQVDDSVLERERAKRVRRTIESTARHVAGCSGTPDCQCAVCTDEERTPNR